MLGTDDRAATAPGPKDDPSMTTATPAAMARARATGALAGA